MLPTLSFGLPISSLILPVKDFEVQRSSRQRNSWRRQLNRLRKQLNKLMEEKSIEDHWKQRQPPQLKVSELHSPGSCCCGPDRGGNELALLCPQRLPRALQERSCWAGWASPLTRYGHCYFCVTKAPISMTLLSTSSLWKPTRLQFTDYMFKIH